MKNNSDKMLRFAVSARRCANAMLAEDLFFDKFVFCVKLAYDLLYGFY